MTIVRTIQYAALALAFVVLTGCTATSPDADAVAERTRTPSPPPSPATTPACIVGTWTAEAADIQPVYDALPSRLEYPAATIDPAASVTISFAADDTFSFTQNVPTSVTWLNRTASVALTGSMTGDYTADGDALALAARENGLTVEPLDDETASAVFAAETAETLAEWPVSASSFTCSADRLVLELGTEGVPATVAFTRG